MFSNYIKVISLDLVQENWIYCVAYHYCENVVHKGFCCMFRFLLWMHFIITSILVNNVQRADDDLIQITNRSCLCKMSPWESW